MPKIAVDGMGGDFAPEEVVKGVAQASLETDIECVLVGDEPQLQGILNGIAYNPETLTLTFRRQPGFMTLYPDKVYITQVKDTEEGLELLEVLAEAINATWEHRTELVAVKNARHAPQWLDIWALLPQTNCKQCGEATCMAFAASLLQQKRAVSECLPLNADSSNADRQAALEAIL